MRCRAENRIDGKTDVWWFLLYLYFQMRHWNDNWEIWVCYQGFSFCLLCVGWSRRKLVTIPLNPTPTHSLWECLQQDIYHVVKKLKVSPWRNWTVLEKRSPHFGFCGFAEMMPIALTWSLYSKVDKLVYKYRWLFCIPFLNIYIFEGTQFSP